MTQSPYSHIADVYDAFVQTDLDIPFFLDQARGTQGPVLELMAGTGRVTLPLVEAGIEVVCVDNAPEMLDILRGTLAARGLSANVRLMDVRELAFERQFNLIMIPFHAFPEITDLDDQRRALARIHDLLSADGRFLCTLHNPKVRLRLVANRALSGASGDSQRRLLVWLHQAYDAMSSLVTVTEFFEEYNASAVLTARRFAEVRFHLLDKATSENLFQEAGFVPVDLYGDYLRAPFRDEDSPFMIWTLKRKAG